MLALRLRVKSGVRIAPGVDVAAANADAAHAGTGAGRGVAATGRVDGESALARGRSAPGPPCPRKAAHVRIAYMPRVSRPRSRSHIQEGGKEGERGGGREGGGEGGGGGGGERN